MAEHNKLGHKGEDMAVRFLISKGHKLLDRNWRFAGYEVDIISEVDGFIVFTEVKTRSSKEWGNPEDFVDTHRMSRLIDAADYYLRANKIDLPARFDIIAILRSGKSYEIRHYEDAFMAV